MFSISFLFMAELYFVLCIYYILSTCSSVYRHLVYTFWLSWMMLLWTCGYKFLCEHMFLVLWEQVCWIMFNFFEELPNCFPYWLDHFNSLPARYENFSFSTSSPILIVHCLKNIYIVVVHLYPLINHPSQCEIVSLWFWFPFHCWLIMSCISSYVGRVYIFFGEMFNQIICPFFNWVILLLLSYEFFI